MQNLEELLLRGYTIYLNGINEVFIGVGIKCLKPKEGEIISLNFSDITDTLSNFPTLMIMLKNGFTLQIYKIDYSSYRVTLGNEVGEGPCAETQAFDVLEDVSAHSLSSGLEFLETESVELLRSKRTKTLNRMYRPYGKYKYEFYK